MEQSANDIQGIPLNRLLKNLEKRVAQKGLNVTLSQSVRLFYRYYPQIETLILENYATLSHNLPSSDFA